MNNNLNKTIFYNSTDSCFTVHGLPWTSIDQPFCRLPQGVFVSKTVDFLKTHPSGAFLSFATNSSFIRVEANVSSKAYMSHMPATGILGCDLYIRKEKSWVFLGTTKIDSESYELNIVEGMPQVMQEYRLYLPLYIGLTHLRVGIDSLSVIQKTEPVNPDKIVFYGTSITQGGCASRPGMNGTSIIGRNVNYEIINLGFSGSAHLEQAMANAIASLDNIKLLVVEAEANAGEILVLKDRLESFIKTIANKQKQMKVIVISHYPYALSTYKQPMKMRFSDHFRFQKQLCLDNGWSFVSGKTVFKKLQYEETVDGVHLTDLGFYFLAQYLQKTIKKILG
ncbi:MAG: SGNH/GDSL hydrolase family protein [Bacilli bacterium]